MTTLTHDIEQEVHQDAIHDRRTGTQVPGSTGSELTSHSDLQLRRLRYSRATFGSTR